MKWIYQILSIVLVAAAGVCLAGCTPDGLQPPDPTLHIITATPRDTAVPTATATPIVPELPAGSLQGQQIDFWYAWEPGAPDALAEVIAWFNAENPEGIEVVGRVYGHPNDLESAVTTSLQTTGAPDVVLAFPYQYQSWRAIDALAILNDYLDSPAYGLGDAWLEDVYPVFWERDVYGGQRVGIPGLFYGQVLLYNRTWAQELGFSAPPQDADGFTSQACAASQANRDGTGGWLIDTNPGTATAWLLAFAGTLEDGEGYAIETPEVKAALTFLSDLRVNGCAWRPADFYPDAAFAGRRGLFYPVSTKEIGYVAAVFEDSESQDSWGPIGYPNDLGETSISVYGRSYIVLRSTFEEQLASWLFIQYLLGEKSQAYLSLMGGYFPLSRNTATRLGAEGGLPAQWFASLDLLENAHNEPRLASWGAARGVVQDAVAEVLDERFIPGQLSLLIRQLADTVIEVSQ